MEFHAWIAVGTLGATIFLLVTKLIPLEATALSIPVVLGATGTIDAKGALSGFGNHAVIAIGAVFILGAGIKDSGIATLMARGLQKLGGKSVTRILFVIMIPTCVLSAFMSNAATVAVFIPAVVALSRRSGIPISRLLMPLGYAAILGGYLTLIATTPNLILGEEVRIRTGHGLQMFDFAKVGAPVALVGIIFMATVGYRFLPKRTAEDRMDEAQLTDELSKSYGFRRNLYRMGIVESSRVVGKTILEAGIGKTYDLEVVQVRRPGPLALRYLAPDPNLQIQVKDELYVEGPAENAWRFSEEEIVQLGLAGPRALERLLGHGTTLAEVALSPHSLIYGKTLREIRFRNQTGLNVVAVWRRGKALRAGLGDLAIEPADAFLVSGPPAALEELRKDPDYVVIGDPSETEDVRKAPVAFLILLAALIPPVLGWMPLAISALGGALAMVGLRVLSFSGAQRAVDFRVLFLIIGTIPLGIALEKHGVAMGIAEGLLIVKGRFGEPGAIAALFLLASVLSMTCNNGAAAVILAPVAAVMVQRGGIDTAKAFLTVAYGASCVFMLPFGNQCNLMVMGPGGYVTKDFLRAGFCLTVIISVATVTLLSVL